MSGIDITTAIDWINRIQTTSSTRGKVVALLKEQAAMCERYRKVLEQYGIDADVLDAALDRLAKGEKP